MDHLPEEFTGSDDHTLIVKGKRTKRQRPSSPFGTAAVTSSSSSGGGGGGGSGSCGDHGGGGGGGDVYSSIIQSPTTSSTEISTSTKEDEDMANCLILLAQGGVGPTQVEEDSEIKTEKFSYIYECKTCNRTFPSFQALGGHRASHKKPKAVAAEEKKVQITPSIDHDHHQQGKFNKMMINPPKPLHSNNKPKIHECSICGSEFTSGQALGGHMRRHRTPTNPPRMITMMSEDDEHEKPRNILPLDLNLPAPPEDDLQDSKFQLITANQQHLVFAAPALVDCHY
uniref:Putative zinc finger protein ZAT5 n=1 Tax=Davidia involucrata TaxID=16924 RepID=A0A5B7A982_DAVIN